MGNSNSNMQILRRAALWLTLAVIILLIVLSVKGSAIKDPEETREFFNSTYLVVFWVGLTGLLIAGLVFFPRLLRKPGLLAIHLGCILILLGAMWSSERGHVVQAKLAKVTPRLFKEKIRRGYMKIAEGDHKNIVTDNKGKPFDTKLPFDIQLDDFWMEYHFDPGTLHILYNPTWTGNPSPSSDQPHSSMLGNSPHPNKQHTFLDPNRIETWSIPAIVGEEHHFPEKPESKVKMFRKVRIRRVFRDMRIVGRGKYKDGSQEQNNPALLVDFEWTDDTKVTGLVFPPGSPHPAAGEGYEFVYMPGEASQVKDYYSELVVMDCENQEQRRKVIEVNKPLHHGGYHFYQVDWDAIRVNTTRGPELLWYTVLSVYSDSGVSVVFLGYWLLCLGVIWQCWLRQILTYYNKRSQNGI